MQGCLCRPVQIPKTLYNGVLGVGLFAQDCGTSCVNSANVGMYYACSGTTCNGGTTVPLASQVINPVAALPVDNNGVILQLPAVPGGVASSASGSLIFGIGTQSNNIPSGVTVYGADQDAEFTTTFNGTQYASFLDTGSNGLFFPAPASLLPACSQHLGSALRQRPAFRDQYGCRRFAERDSFVPDRQCRQPVQYVKPGARRSGRQRGQQFRLGTSFLLRAKRLCGNQWDKFEPGNRSLLGVLTWLESAGAGFFRWGGKRTGSPCICTEV